MTIKVKAKAVPGSHVYGFASTGTEQVGVRVECLDGELAGQSVTWYGYFTEQSERRTLESLAIMGGDINDVIPLPGLGSTEFELVLEEETADDGSVHYKPAFVNRIGVAMKQQMDEGQKRAFAARMRGLARDITGGAPQQQTQQRQAPRGAPQQQRAPQQQQRPQQNGRTYGGGNRNNVGPSDYQAPPDDDIPF
jgi:hypothetical protein